MEINKITTTNLSLLRKILEGKYDDAFCRLNCKDIELDERIDTVDERDRKLRNKNKNRPKKSKKAEFYLNGDDEFLKDWLKKKEKLIREKRKEKVKLWQEQKCNREKMNKEHEERLLQARESYDKWLKEIRNRNRRTSPKLARPESANLQKTKIAEEAFKNWLRNKENLPNQKRHSDDSLIKSHDKETKVPQNNASTMNENKVCKDSMPNVKRTRINNNDRLTKSKVKSKSENYDEDLQQIIRDLRKAKLKQIEKSKRRVDSGIIFNREKEKKNVVLLEKSENFQWVMAIEERGDDEKFIEQSKSDSRARKVDLINHHHDNPFVEKTKKHNINTSGLFDTTNI